MWKRRPCGVAFFSSAVQANLLTSCAGLHKLLIFEIYFTRGKMARQTRLQRDQMIHL
ncbi:hypothetical protein SAMN05519105_1396 [Rhodobacter sp. 24-YEA-8]|nr:hypothetical protein SAMN05519105_1396 [Rhodobacter sp. 24-YEA-8]